MVPIAYRLEDPLGITVSEARNNLFSLIERVNNGGVPVKITSPLGDAVLVSRAQYEALEETANLLRSPANARRLMENLAEARNSDRQEHPLPR